MISHDLIGTWDLVSLEVRSGEKTAYPLGQDAKGVLIYDQHGRFSVQLARVDRPEFASGDLAAGTDDEMRAAYQGYIAYFGKYELDQKDGSVTHHVDQSLFPNWAGGPQKRYTDLVGSRLTLRAPPIKFRGSESVGIIVWERVS